MNQHEIFMEALRHVARLCAVAAMTAPKSGGQLFLKGAKPFIETVIIEDKEIFKRLAEWQREAAQIHVAFERRLHGLHRDAACTR